MKDAKRLAAMVDAALKRVDSGVIAERAFYDEVSDRLYITIFEGPRKTEMVLIGSDFTNGDQAKVDQMVDSGLKRLRRSPIG